MKYVCIDIETTGLDPATCQVLEVAAVVDDLSSPAFEPVEAFRCLVHHNRLTGDPYALAMNAALVEELSTAPHYAIPPEEVGPALRQFLTAHGFGEGRVLAGGKNFTGFDRPFLERLPGFSRHVGFSHRALDPAMLFLAPGDARPPSLAECLVRAGLFAPGDAVPHTALDDARLTCRAIRAGLGLLGYYDQIERGW